MTTPIYQTHEVVKRLTAAGMPLSQAEAVVNEQVQLMADQLATKADFQALASNFEHKFELLRSEMKAGDDSLRSEIAVLRAEMQAMESRITGRLSTLMIGLAAALAAVMKWL